MIIAELADSIVCIVIVNYPSLARRISQKLGQCHNLCVGISEWAVMDH